MSDDKQARNAPDNSRIDLNDRHEMRHWRESLGVSEEQLRRAVEQAGTSASKVREYLRNRP